MSDNECRNYYHTAECKKATELMLYPHKMILAEEHLDWVKGDMRCEHCYVWKGSRLSQPCGDHPDRPPTLTIQYPICNGCYNQCSHDGENICCETCGVFWSDGYEDEYAQPYEEKPHLRGCGVTQ